MCLIFAIQKAPPCFPKGFCCPKETTKSFIPLPGTSLETWMNQSSLTYYLPALKRGQNTQMVPWRTRHFSPIQSSVPDNGIVLNMHNFTCYISQFSSSSRSCVRSWSLSLFSLWWFFLWFYDSPTKLQWVTDSVDCMKALTIYKAIFVN